MDGTDHFGPRGVSRLKIEGMAWRGYVGMARRKYGGMMIRFDGLIGEWSVVDSDE